MLNLDNGETIILEVRKHWIVLVSQAIASGLCIVLPPVVFALVRSVSPEALLLIPHEGATFAFLYFLWLMVVWIVLFIQWTNYYLDVWYVTEKRIIDVEQKRAFHREVSSIRFDKIQDITVEVKGVIATFFNYGDVRVQTASEDSRDFSMTVAANPERIRKIIFSQHNRESERTQKVRIVDEDHDGVPDHLQFKGDDTDGV
jgi:hypothetical protein